VRDLGGERAARDQAPQRIEVGVEGLAGPGERDERAHRVERPACAGADRVGGGSVPQLDGLGRDDELDRDEAACEIDQLGEPAGGERRHVGPVLEALGLARARDLERDRLSEQARLDRERLRRPGVLGETALGRDPRCVQPVAEPGLRCLQQLDHALVGGADGRDERDAHEVERHRER
jgi:hypothetical protein